MTNRRLVNYILWAAGIPVELWRDVNEYCNDSAMIFGDAPEEIAQQYVKMYNLFNESKGDFQVEKSSKFRHIKVGDQVSMCCPPQLNKVTNEIEEADIGIVLGIDDDPECEDIAVKWRDGTLEVCSCLEVELDRPLTREERNQKIKREILRPAVESDNPVLKTLDFDEDIHHVSIIYDPIARTFPKPDKKKDHQHYTKACRACGKFECKHLAVFDEGGMLSPEAAKFIEELHVDHDPSRLHDADGVNSKLIAYHEVVPDAPITDKVRNVSNWPIPYNHSETFDWNIVCLRDFLDPDKKATTSDLRPTHSPSRCNDEPNYQPQIKEGDYVCVIGYVDGVVRHDRDQVGIVKTRDSGQRVVIYDTVGGSFDFLNEVVLRPALIADLPDGSIFEYFQPTADRWDRRYMKDGVVKCKNDITRMDKRDYDTKHDNVRIVSVPSLN